MQKIRLFHHFVVEMQSFKNTAICLVESVLAHISGTRIFPSMWFVQEYSKYYKISLWTKFRKKLMTLSSNKFKKPCFWPIFPMFGTKKISWKIWLCHAQLHVFLAPCQNLEKVNNTIQRKCLDRQTEGWTDPIL